MEGQSVKPQFFDAEAAESRFSKSTKKILKDSAKRGEGVRGKYLKRYTEIQSVLKTQTYHEGANDERTAILAIVRRMVKEQPEDTEVMISGTSLVKKLLTRVKRNKAKLGGL